MTCDDRFAQDHAPGSMILTASMLPCLIVPPDFRPRWAPSPYSYGLHLLGDVPLPEGDIKTLRRGKLMEPVGKALLAEDHGINVPEIQVRMCLDSLPAVTYLDGVQTGGDWAVEFKSMPERIYRDQWADGPPLWVRVQCQAQQMIADGQIAGCLIVPIVISYAGNPDIPTIYEEPRNEQTGAMLLETGSMFLEMLRARELPAPDETVASYDALVKTMRIDQGETVVLADDEAAHLFREWQNAKDFQRGGEAIVSACKRRFAARVGNAAVIEIPGVGRIERRQIDKKAYEVAAHSEMRWTLKEAAE